MSVLFEPHSSLLRTSGTGLRKRSPGETVAREPTTTGVALKQLNSHKWHECSKYTSHF